MNIARSTRALILGLVLAALTVGGVGALEASPDMAALAKGNSALASDLYGQLIKEEKGNLFFSPFSVSTALAMTYAGARGKTEEEMAKALHFSLEGEKLHAAFSGLLERLKATPGQDQIQLHAANSLWPQKDYGFQKNYLELLKKYYGSSVTPLDYLADPILATKQINAWVSDKTQGKIDPLLSVPLDKDTRLTLVNAVYFKGLWSSPFEAYATQPGDFFTGGEIVQVPFMQNEGEFLYGQEEGLELLELPYKGGKVSMLILLPAEAPDGLEKLEKSLEKLAAWRGALEEAQVEVFLPKFKLEWGTQSLKDSLAALGMKTAFGFGADFSGMSSKAELYISDVLHKAFVEVNEEGTEAAAATAVMELALSAPPPSRQVVFRADRPFLFLILEKSTGTILFLGRLMKPIEKQ